MKNLTALAVFCGSRAGEDPAHRDCAVRLGELIAEKGVRLVYGGGGIGLMGIAAETVLGRGGRVDGVIPEFLMKYELAHPENVELQVTDSMHERKRRMFEMADAFVILPGGLGTLDEAFEIITWKQLRLHSKPIVLLNVNGYWDPFVTLVERTIAGGFAHPAVSELFSVVSSAEQVFDAIAAAPEPKEEVLTSHL